MTPWRIEICSWLNYYFYEVVFLTAVILYFYILQHCRMHKALEFLNRGDFTTQPIKYCICNHASCVRSVNKNGYLITDNYLVEMFRISPFLLISEWDVLGWSMLRVHHSSGEMIEVLSCILLQDRKRTVSTYSISFESFYVRLSP